MKKVFDLKPATIIEIISALFILLFVYTAMSKLFDFDSFKSTLRLTPEIGKNYELVAWTLPFTEIIVAIFLLMPRLKLFGLYGSFFLMCIFTIFIAYLLVFKHNNLPCSCGGVLKEMTWSQHLIFNIFFTLLALTGILLERKRFKSRTQKVESAPLVFT